MIRFSDYRKNNLIHSLNKSNLIEGIDKHFELLQLDLLEAIKLPQTINEGYLGETAWILEQIAAEDYSKNKSLVKEHVSFFKSNFHNYMFENIDFDSFLNSGGPNGINSLNQTEQLKRKIKWAIDGFKDNVRKLIEPILNNRSGDSQIDSTSAGAGTGGVPFGPTSGGGGSTPPNTAAGGGQSSGTPTGGGGGSSQASSGGGSTASATTGPNAGNSGGPTSSATGWTSPMGNSHAPTGSNSVPAGSNVPWWNRKTQHGPSIWKGVSNLAKSARKGIWDRLKAGWRGDNLADSTRAEIVNLVENLFLENSINILDTIDQWSEKLYKYLSDNIDTYAQTMGEKEVNTRPRMNRINPQSMNAEDNPISDPSILSPNRNPGQPIPKDVSSSIPTPSKRGLSLMDDSTFENLIRSGQPITPSLLANKAANMGYVIDPEVEGGIQLARYNKFREKYGLSPLDKFPPWETKNLTQSELTKYKNKSEDKLKTVAEQKTGKAILRKLGKAFGLEIPGKGADVAIWKNFASLIYQKLQSNESPNVSPDPINVQIPNKEAQSTADAIDPFSGFDDESPVTSPTSNPGNEDGTDLKSSNGNDDIWNWDLGQNQDIDQGQDPTSQDIDQGQEPASQDIDQGQEPTERFNDIKSGVLHDLEAFEKGTMVDGNLINLPNAKNSMISDEELTSIIDRLGPEGSENNILTAAHNLFVDKYSAENGKDRNNILSKMNRIDQDRLNQQSEEVPEDPVKEEDNSLKIQDVLGKLP